MPKRGWRYQRIFTNNLKGTDMKLAEILEKHYTPSTVLGAAEVNAAQNAFANFHKQKWFWSITVSVVTIALMVFLVYLATVAPNGAEKWALVGASGLTLPFLLKTLVNFAQDSSKSGMILLLAQNLTPEELSSVIRALIEGNASGKSEN